MSIIKKTALAAAMAAFAASTPSVALEKGDFIVRLGGALVSPNDSGDAFNGPAAAGASVKPGVQASAKPSIMLEYMFTDNIGLNLLGAAPFDHDITAEINGAGIGEVGNTKHLPPTLTANWHFDTMGGFTPFVGAGVNYTHFFNENTTGALNGLNLNLDDSVGPAAMVGFDWDAGDNVLFNMSLYYMKIKTEAHVSGGFGNSDVDIDPWVFSTGLGYKF